MPTIAGTPRSNFHNRRTGDAQILLAEPLLTVR
jgi:hypothetical protein